MVNSFLFPGKKISKTLSCTPLCISREALALLRVVPHGFDGPCLGEGQILGFPAFQLAQGDD